MVSKRSKFVAPDRIDGRWPRRQKPEALPYPSHPTGIERILLTREQIVEINACLNRALERQRKHIGVCRSRQIYISETGGHREFSARNV